MCLRWLSVQLMAVAAAIQGAFMVMPVELGYSIPEWLKQALVMVFIVAAIAGRLIEQKRPKGVRTRATDSEITYR